MKMVKSSKKEKIKHFFENSPHKDSSFLKCYFQDKMGVAYVDSIINPKSVQICVGDFSFYAGEPNISLVKNIKFTAKHRGSLIIEPDDEWKDLFLEHYGDEKVSTHYRQSFLNKYNFFDITKLKYYVNNLHDDFYIQPIDEELYLQVLEQTWSEDFCVNYDTYKDFEKNGIGYVVLTKDLFGKYIIVAGASSYIYFDNGIEIQIATNKLYRNKGFATSVGAKLILECIERDINPCWDSANKLSSKLAKKLGYRPLEFYQTIHIKI